MQYRSWLIYVGIICLPFLGSAQPQQVLDRIVAVIGEEVILDSDIQNQYNYLIINGEKDNGELQCQVMDQLIISKLLLNKARQDSIEVGEAQVEAELEQRMAFILQKIDRSEFEKIDALPWE
ncbi:MAG: SurA N-terminal domain-containing protein [Bacteroidota bacterium]